MSQMSSTQPYMAQPYFPQPYIPRPYGSGIGKIISAILGVVLIIIGAIIFLYFYLIRDDLWLGAISLTAFVSGAVICFVVTIILHFRRSQPYYSGAPPFYSAQPTQYQQAPQQSIYPGAPQPFDMSGVTFQQQTSVNQYSCPTCNRPLKYISTYQKWLCENCNRWL